MVSVKTSSAESEALRANKLTLVERLTDDLAHEIKNPLHSLVINLEVLRRRISRSSAEEMEDLLRYVGILSSELDRVSGRVDLMLRMVRPDRSAEDIAISEALEELLDLVELERERRGVEITVDPSYAAPRARLPRETARQIVLNLLLLAIDAAGRGGSVRISATAGDDDDCLALGITPASGRVMKPSENGRPDHKAMVDSLRALVTSSGGELRVESGASPEAPPSALRVSIPAAVR